MATDPETATLLHLAFIDVARRHWNALAIADSTGQRLTYGRALTAALAFARVLARRTPGQTHVATLLPASVGGALANIALFLADRIPVNLNFTLGPASIEDAMARAGLRTIVTSRQFLTKAGIEPTPAMVFLEDLRQEVTGPAKIRALALARFAPRSVLARLYGWTDRPPSSLATLIFSSGSTGVPKGVMLSHAAVLANVHSLKQIFPVGPGHCFIGVLPFFHSFGFTGTLWFPLLQGAAIAYHPIPTDAKTIGELAETYRATMLISTPTFCNAYIRRVPPEQFKYLRWAIVGAEKLREPVASEFRERFGLGLLEGYGCTEMAPVVAVNLPDLRDTQGCVVLVRTRAGSVGRPIPNVEARVVDRDTGEPLDREREGMLQLRGPNMMTGYLNDPARTADVVREGWYVTGDIARIDPDGFIFITDRVSRFSKIGGEMVPHLRIEDTINSILGSASTVVTAVPDRAKGERLVAFYARPDVGPEVVWNGLNTSDLPKLWIPKRENLVPIDAIPTLGTGKIDLQRIRAMAAERQATDA